MWVYCLLPFVLIAVVLFGIGVYELIVESREDGVVFDGMNQSLVLKHLEQVNRK